MNPVPTLGLSVEPDVHSALWARFVAPVLDGSEGFVQQVSFVGVDDLVLLFPVGSVVVDVTTNAARQVLVVTPAWTATATRWRGDRTHVWVRAAETETLAKAVAEIRANAPIVEPDPSNVTVDFWQVGRAAYTTTRSIEAPAWMAISDHYPGEVGEALGRLTEHIPSLDGGRIMLWYGPPGTGKTTAIRALARAWRDRARFQVVLDPDAVLSRAATLMEVLLSEDSDNDQWRVLVIEDADELVRADAKHRVGQALSRLLNVGDGIVGQGVKVMVLITTNEPIDRVHPALGRPGRCLAQVEFRRFTRDEARNLCDELPPGADFSLAELLAAPAIETIAAAPAPGLYL